MTAGKMKNLKKIHEVVAICCNFLPGFQTLCQNVGASMRAPKAAKVPVSS